MRVLLVCLALANFLSADDFSPADVKIAGALDYEDTSEPIEYSQTPRYSALVFNGKPGDRIEAAVDPSTPQTTLALADGALKKIASGNGRLSATLPGEGSDPEAFYLIVWEEKYRPAKFRLQLHRKTDSSALVSKEAGGKKSAVPEYLACSANSDCVAVPKAGCCNNGYKAAVNRNFVEQYKAANACKEQGVRCAQFLVNDTRVASCNTEAKQCEMIAAPAGDAAAQRESKP